MTTKITCYDYGGLAYPNNTKCPSSDSCCQTADQCRPGLCGSNNNTDVIARGACTDYPWSLQTCAQICLYATEMGFLPRANTRPDSSYCCDDDLECCAKNAGVFLNSDGVATGLANETTVPSTMLSISPTSNAAATSLISTTAMSLVSTALSTPTTLTSVTQSPTKQSQTSSTARTAVEVAVPLSVLAIFFVSLGLFYYRRRLRPKPTLKGTTELSGTAQFVSRPKADLLNPAELWTEPAELPAEQR